MDEQYVPGRDVGTDYEAHQGAADAAHAGQLAVDDLVHLLDLERLDDLLFRGVRAKSPLPRVFGGQVAGQALVAAGRTVEPSRRVHSLHSYFIRGGDPSIPILFSVDRVRDGRSFSVRRVVAVQHGETIFTLSASFQEVQPGVEHAQPMPDVPLPDQLPSLDELLAGHDVEQGPLASANRPIDMRWVDDPGWGQADRKPLTGLRRVWMRANGHLPDEPLLHSCVMTFASDMTLLDTVTSKLGITPGQDTVAMASLDHAMWFLRPFRADEWFLFATDAPAATGGRGLATGRFFRTDGVHVASAVQEGMIRLL